MKNDCSLFINWTSYTLIKTYLECIALTVPGLKHTEQENNYCQYTKINSCFMVLYPFHTRMTFSDKLTSENRDFGKPSTPSLYLSTFTLQRLAWTVWESLGWRIRHVNNDRCNMVVIKACLLYIITTSEMALL